ncbi:hypothetical protein KUTeg_000594, partial [Tegillarca granosa]
VRHTLCSSKKSQTKRLYERRKGIFFCLQGICLPENIPPNELDTLLAGYFLNAKKGNGTERTMNVTYCKILSSNIQDVLTTKWKHLKTQGKRNRPHWADELTLEDIESLYKSGNLGTLEKNILAGGEISNLESSLHVKNIWSLINVLQKLALEKNRHCPVAAYKQYVENTPNGWKDDQEAPFYVACNPKFKE